ncbi:MULTISPECIES: hypothetical protein [unclassified Streptomyces]|uniref:hypothetical protein n=1 Tax=unclassified Streptomyces TaxID=2593676 RepID=UPI000AA18F83|nr:MULTISPECIES: hypothetical protein [unclassified Streptomyces]
MPKTIKKLAPEAGRTDTEGLRAYDADALAKCAADARQPWWRRRACVEAPAGRVPERRVAELIACVQVTGDVSEVRIALLRLLADRPELLPWLRHEDRQQDGAYGMAEAVLGTRGALGDLTAAGALATLAFDLWRSRREIGEAGLNALVARHGLEAVLAELGGDRPEDRSTAVRLRDRAGEDVTDALADPDRQVAFRAQELLTDPERLRGHLAGAPTEEAKLWAVYALHRLTENADETRKLYEELGRPASRSPAWTRNCARRSSTSTGGGARSGAIRDGGSKPCARSRRRPSTRTSSCGGPRPHSPPRASRRSPRSPAVSTKGRGTVRST